MGVICTEIASFCQKIELHLFYIEQSYATFKGDDVQAIERILRCHIYREIYHKAHHNEISKYTRMLVHLNSE